MIKGRKGRQNFVKKSNQFCQDILDLEISRPESLANLVMSLSSYEFARTPVELSESILYARKHHSVYRSIQDLAKDSESYEKASKSIRDLCFSHACIDDNIYTWQTDVTAMVKPHSPCLEDRVYVHVPNNVIAGNKSLSKGYKYSYINLGLNQPAYLEKEEVFFKEKNTKWTAPLSTKRVAVNETPRETAQSQIKSLLSDGDLPFGKALLICNTLDSYYGNALFLSGVHQYDNLVNIVRFRSGIKIYPEAREFDTGGAPKIYGACHYLIQESGLHDYKYKGEIKQKHRDSILDLACEEELSFQSHTAKGKLLRIEIKRFNNMMIRSKKDSNMKDKAFDLLYCRVFDEEKEKPLFKPMWLAITGEKRRLLTTLQAYCKYSHRYDIEPFFRFSKQKLLLDKYQTPSIENLDNWVLIVQMATWLLWTASDEAQKNPKAWQKHLPEYKAKETKQISEQEEQQADINKVESQLEQSQSKSERLTIAQTRKGAQNLFSTFDKKPFAVQKSNKGKGRKEGTKLKKRKRCKVVKKDKNLVQKRAT